jgi:hypothetical protein
VAAELAETCNLRLVMKVDAGGVLVANWTALVVFWKRMGASGIEKP